LLPHFGEKCDVNLVIKGAVKAEKLGFDSVWVRDHMIFYPHGMEGENNNFLEPFSTLSIVSNQTSRLTLGTGTLIPIRHPILTAKYLMTLSQISGGRVIAGFGAGTFKGEYDALGYPFDKRPEFVREHIEVVKKLMKEDDVTYNGQFFKFQHVTLNPKPVKEIPIWYGGGTPAAARRAVTYCDGWIPGRINFPTFEARVNKINRLSKKLGKPRPTIGAIPIVSIDKDKETALKKVNLHGLIENANEQKWWKKPPSGKFEKAEELEGSFIFGSPKECCKDIEKYVQLGLEHLVFDLRFRFDEFDECLTLLGKEVIPSFK
jgi:probable F420-dependent oxidoreductase